jgi:hypothetical protein
VHGARVRHLRCGRDGDEPETDNQGNDATQGRGLMATR